MGAVESVLREVEKVTIRPLGEVARGVEKVTIRPLGEVARGVEKVTIRPLGEIARELEKVTIRPLGEVARGLEKVTIRPLGEIASDLERLLRKPLGGIASRTVLLMERVKEVVEQDASINSNIDRQARRENLNAIAADAVQLQGDINETILITPPTESDDLQVLNGFHTFTSNMLDGVETLQDNEDVIQNQKEMKQNIAALTQGRQELIENNTALTQDRQELIKNNTALTQDRQELIEDNTALIQDNTYLASENNNLRSRLDQLEAMFRDFIVNENNSDQSILTHSSDDEEEFNISADFA